MRKLAFLPVVVLAFACTDSAPVAPDADLAAATAVAKQMPGPAYFADTGNYYDAVADAGVTWGDAYAAAMELRYRSCTGHLATVTSQAENDFIATTFPDAATGGYWLGGAQTPGFGEPAGGWGWVTGEPFVFTNWNGGEPNDAWPPCDPDNPLADCNENRIHFAGPFADPGNATFWNDEWEGNFSGAVSGYVVEYDCGSSGPVMAHVTGHGNLTVGGELRTFSFNARKYADGSVEGEYQLHSRAAGSKWHGNVTCFAIEGNRVWLGGAAERGNFTPPNGGAGWSVVDNGEGAGAPADQMSLQWVNAGPGFASAYCSATPEGGEPYDLALLDIEGGNIQIHTP